MKIAICDDDKSVVTKLSHYLKQKSDKMHEGVMEVWVYHCGEDFLKDVESGMKFHIVFMDIEMGTMNGIAVGHQFRKNSEYDDVIFIYISSHRTYSQELLDIGNVRFIRKPISKELDIVFTRAVAQAQKYIDKTPAKFIYTVNKDLFSVNLDMIVYLKSSGKFLELYIWDNVKREIILTDRYYSTIADATKQLPNEKFFQCERAHVVNLAFVKRTLKSSFILMDVSGTQLPIGKTYRAQVQKVFFNHRGIVRG